MFVFAKVPTLPTLPPMKPLSRAHGTESFPMLGTGAGFGARFYKG